MLNPPGEFGFTNDPAFLDAVVAFRDAAVKDGWTLSPTYPNHEAWDRAAKLERDGFSMMVLSRADKDGDKKYRYEAKVNLWGPDGLQIKPPNTYDWNEIQRRTRTCNYCHKSDVETQRVGFGGRCCSACYPAVKKRIEYPGWYN